MKNKYIELFGWYATAAIIGAYALNNLSLIETQSIIYQLLNLTGALGIVIISLRKNAYQPAVLNIIWLVIALIGIINILINA